MLTIHMQGLNVPRQNILITGASSGLGLTMAKQFADKGYDLILCARRVSQLEQLKQEILTVHSQLKVETYALDVNDHDQVFAVFADAKTKFSTLDKVIVNAGIGKGASLGKGFFEANRETAQTNFVAALAQCEAALEIFRAQNHGHLITISSVSSQRGFKGSMNVYAATKAAIASLTEGIRIDVLNKPIDVTCIHPGYIDTEITDKVNVPPFIVDAETGCRAIIKAIEKKKATAFVPFWPWALVRYLLKIMPVSMLRKFT